MGIATLTDHQDKLKSEFSQLKALLHISQNLTFPGPEFNQLSIGMSGDYQLALENGSTMVRIGSKIFIDTP